MHSAEIMQLRQPIHFSHQSVAQLMWSGFKVQFTVLHFIAVIYYKCKVPPFRKQLQKQNVGLAAPILNRLCKRSMGPYGQQKQKSSNSRIAKVARLYLFRLEEERNVGIFWPHCAATFIAVCPILYFARNASTHASPCLQASCLNAIFQLLLIKFL